MDRQSSSCCGETIHSRLEPMPGMLLSFLVDTVTRDTNVYFAVDML